MNKIEENAEIENEQILENCQNIPSQQVTHIEPNIGKKQLTWVAILFYHLRVWYSMSIINREKMIRKSMNLKTEHCSVKG